MAQVDRGFHFSLFCSGPWSKFEKQNKNYRLLGLKSIGSVFTHLTSLPNQSLLFALLMSFPLIPSKPNEERHFLSSHMRNIILLSRSVANYTSLIDVFWMLKIVTSALFLLLTQSGVFRRGCSLSNKHSLMILNLLCSSQNLPVLTIVQRIMRTLFIG